MLRWCILVLLIVTCCGAVVAKKSDNKDKDKKETAQPYTGPKKRLAVMDMEVKVTAASSTTPTAGGGSTTTSSVTIPPPTDFGQGLTEMLTTALIDTKRFILLERKALEDIKAESARGTDGTTDASTAPPAGKLLGAQALVRGAVTEYSYHYSASNAGGSFIPGISLSTASAEAMVALDIRLYDTTTGQILDSVRAEGKAKGKAVGIDIDKNEVKMSASNFQQSPLGKATREAIEKAVAKIVERMETMPWEARIAEIDPGENGAPDNIYLNRGSDAGLKVGDVLEIYHPGRPITDPETKVVIGRTKDTRVGVCKVDSVTPKLSIVIPSEGQGFQKNDVVRFPPPPPPPPQPEKKDK
ncbi:MAG TPA: CsgG/HfaB family protein [Armatimonadota bacterium]|nr:CsgG/HfaB family protein [Armatimonadota bacterium]